MWQPLIEARAAGPWITFWVAAGLELGTTWELLGTIWGDGNILLVTEVVVNRCMHSPKLTGKDTYNGYILLYINCTSVRAGDLAQ